MEKQRSRTWCFTINNYTQDDVNLLNQVQCKYIVFGYEIGESGTPHLQGFIYFDDAKTLSTLKKKIHKTAHFEIANGTPLQAATYCKKDGRFEERGELPCSQGKRNDLDVLKDKIVRGMKVDEIVMDKPIMYHQYGRTLHKIEDLMMRKKFRNFQTIGEWIYGPTATGKSSLAFEGYHPDTHYVYKYDNSDWQDGYEQQDIVIIDEFRGQLPLNALLTMIDRHPNHFMKRRGREPLPFVSKKVIITSSMHPSDVFKNLSADDKLEQLYRRITIKHLI